MAAPKLIELNMTIEDARLLAFEFSRAARFATAGSWAARFYASKVAELEQAFTAYGAQPLANTAESVRAVTTPGALPK